MSEYLKASEILQKLKEAHTNFSFKTKLQVIKRIKKYTKDRRPFISMVFRDLSGEVPNITKWTNSEEDYQQQIKKFEIGNIIEFTGRYKVEFSSFDIREPKKLNRSEYNIEDFVKSIQVEKTVLFKEIETIIKNLKNVKLKTLLEKVFSDEEIKSRYIECPSSIIHHHNYKYGNLHHTVGMINLFNQLVEFYEKETLLDIDLIYVGIILHDIGKIFEFSLNNDLPMKTSEGKLYGHLILGDQFVSKIFKKIEDIPKDLENRIRHLILSHHGKIEWGSIVEPQFAEAEILHLLDMLDSRFKLNH